MIFQTGWLTLHSIYSTTINHISYSVVISYSSKGFRVILSFLWIWFFSDILVLTQRSETRKKAYWRYIETGFYMAKWLLGPPPWQQGCNSVDIFFSSQGLSQVMFGVKKHILTFSAIVVPELVPIFHPVLCQNLWMSIKLHPRTPPTGPSTSTTSRPQTASGRLIL